MQIWFGLLVAPLLALADQIIAYATVDWACHHGHSVAVHAVHALFLAAAFAGTLAAWQLWHRVRPGRAGDEALAQRQFLAGLAMVVAALSALVIAAMWMPTWVMPPCVN